MGSNTTKGKLTVKSNVSWQVTVIDYGNTAKPWHMAQWNGNSFVNPGAALGDPLSVTAGQNTVSESTPNVLLTGVGKPNDENQSFTTTYKQNLSAQDKSLPSGQTYHITLKYVAFATL